MENKRILNRIIFINIGNTDYSSVEIAGNTCFVGTNNMGKTTLQRAILFFYSANTRQLGISSSQKTFEDYYFQYPNSYIIYEVATEEGFFHIMVYRNTKLFYRFVDGPFEQELYISDKEAVQPKAVLTRLNERKIDYSDQIETFERYRNIVYGADPDKRYKRFALMKGNTNYHNIPLAITSIFLSSESVIKAEFVKDCIANAIGSRHTTIELKTIERQLRQFAERYQDIETFFRKESNQRSDLIRDNFSSIRELKQKQKTLAAELGGALKYGMFRRDEISATIGDKDAALTQLRTEFEQMNEQHRKRNEEISQDIGGFRLKLREAEKRRVEYEELGIADLLREAEDKPRLQTDFRARTNEYATLTATFTDLEQQYKALFDGLENERREFELTIRSEGLKLDARFQEEKNKLRDAFLLEKESLQSGQASESQKLKDVSLTYELALKDAIYKEKQIRQHVYFPAEIGLVSENLDDIRRRKHEFDSLMQVKNSAISFHKKESDHIKERYRLDLEQFSTNNQTAQKQLNEDIKKIDEKLAVYQTALFGFLQEHYPDWYQTIGKVCHESLLFSQQLKPELLKTGLDTLYGLKLDLSSVEVHCKTLEQYEQQRSLLYDQISTAQQDYLVFREQKAQEEQSQLASLSKKIAQLKNEITQLEYKQDQDLQKEREYELNLHDLRRKGEEHRERELIQVYHEQEQLSKNKSDITIKLGELAAKYKTELEAVQNRYEERLVKLKKTQDREASKLGSQKDDKLADLEERKGRLEKEKSAVLKKKGIDDSRLKKLKKEIEALESALNAIEANSETISAYRKDKRELFDQVDDFSRQKANLEDSKEKASMEFEKVRKEFESRYQQYEKDLKNLRAELSEFTDGLEYFEKHFRDKILYDRLRHLIEPAPAARSETGITALCSQLLANENEFHNKFSKFRENISDFAGRFRSDNHFNFRINPAAGETEYERFASYLEEFYSENKIQVSIAEVAKSHGMLIDAIASKMRALTEYRGRISKMISKMEADFSKASFESSRLIEYIKLKSEDSENKVLRKLQRIADFREQNPFLYGETNLVNTGIKGKGEIDKKSVEMLNDLQKAIQEENYEEINVQDLFELRFRIKEGRNDTGWIEKIDKVGSTGTDMLVKAVIYITLLNVFIKESTDKTARNFKVHCIIDEVGQISAPYLKELIAFAEERDICLINGLPNESKLETHYNYTYKFRKDSNGFVKVIPLLTMSIEP